MKSDKSKNALILICAVFALSLFATASFSFERFPQPEFEGEYIIPQTSVPQPRSAPFEYLDLAVLATALLAASYFSLKGRNRRGILLLTIFSLLYFGFWRKGCICPVGSIQNMTQALTDSSVAVPFTVIAIFSLPLITALFFGRAFCNGVCPLGAIQELVIIKPVKIPRWISAPLSLVPIVYLGIAVIAVAFGAGFLICRYDPFIAIFRMGGSMGMLLFGGILLAVGAIFARPYCRFLCPYGVLLGWASRISWFRVKITPTTCINCRLCEESCPVDAIIPAETPQASNSEKNRKLFRRLILLLPFILAAGAFSGFIAGKPLAGIHPQVSLAREIAAEEAGIREDISDRSRVFRFGTLSMDDLFKNTYEIEKKMIRAGMLLGIFLAAVIWLKMLAATVKKRRINYEPDSLQCLSCARCFSSCPQKSGSTGKLEEYSE